MSARVFVSHSHEDAAAYSSLCLALDSSGVSRWDVSGLTVGNQLASSLQHAIEKCDLCVFLATQRSLKSRWCLAELGAFWGAGKPVIIFQSDPDIREADLPPQFLGNLWTTDALRLVKTIKETTSGQVAKIGNGYGIRVDSRALNIRFGRIELLVEGSDDNLCALPANEYFDDDCIHDNRSALGAFMQHHYKEKIVEIQELVRAALPKSQNKQFEKQPGQKLTSYGIGACAFLDQPLSTSMRIAMVAVTTHRANVGIRADAAYIFAAAQSLYQLMANKRMSRLFIPVLGSGHGGLKSETAVVYMVAAFSELQRRAGSHLKEVNIIVYRRDENSEPSISESTVRRILAFSGSHL